MNQAREELSHTWQHIQSFLFPIIRQELGELTAKQKQLVSILEVAKLEAGHAHDGVAKKWRVISVERGG